jgi:hypothetical protein
VTPLPPPSRVSLGKVVALRHSRARCTDTPGNGCGPARGTSATRSSGKEARAPCPPWLWPNAAVGVRRADARCENVRIRLPAGISDVEHGLWMAPKLGSSQDRAPGLWESVHRRRQFPAMAFRGQSRSVHGQPRINELRRREKACRCGSHLPVTEPSRRAHTGPEVPREPDGILNKSRRSSRSGSDEQR